jgi:hypothetical protein
VCGRHQLLGIRMVDARQFDAQISGDAEPTFRARTDTDGGGDFGFGWDPELELLSGNLERADETGRVASGKQLLGVRAIAPCAAKF